MSKDLSEQLRKYGEGREAVDIMNLRSLLNNTTANDKKAKLTSSNLCYLSSFPLHRAARKNDLGTLKCMFKDFSEQQAYELLTTHLTINAYRSFMGGELKRSANECVTTLHIAVYEGHNEMLEYILKLVPTKQLLLLKWLDDNGNTALHFAAIENKPDTVLCILETIKVGILSDVCNFKNKKNQTIGVLAAPQLYHLSTKRDLTQHRSRILNLESMSREQREGLTNEKAEIGKLRELSQRQDKNLLDQQTSTLALQQKCVQHSEAMDEMREEMLAHREQIKSLMERNTEQEKENKKHAEALEETEKKAAANARYIQVLEGKNAQLEQENRAQGEELVRQGREICTLKEESQRQDKNLSLQKEEIKVLQVRCAEHSTDLTNHNADIIDLGKSRTEHADAISKAESDREAHLKQIKELQGNIIWLEREKQQLGKELTTKISAVKQECNRQKNEMSNLSELVVRLTKENSSVEQEMQKMTGKLAEMQAALEEMQVYVTTPFCTDATGDQEQEGTDELPQ